MSGNLRWPIVDHRFGFTSVAVDTQNLDVANVVRATHAQRHNMVNRQPDLRLRIPASQTARSISQLERPPICASQSARYPESFCPQIGMGDALRIAYPGAWAGFRHLVENESFAVKPPSARRYEIAVTHPASPLLPAPIRSSDSRGRESSAKKRTWVGMFRIRLARSISSGVHGRLPLLRREM